MTLVAKLEPLSGKYYGTEVTITNTELQIDSTFRVWINQIGNYKLSKRELEARECTQDDYGVWREEWRNIYKIYDTHCETEIALEVCEVIVDALNKHFGQKERVATGGIRNNSVRFWARN